MINMDSQIPNKVVEEWIKQGNLFPDAIVIRPEKTYRKSRFDLYVEEGDRKIFVEVKGVTLEENGIVKFPDAPVSYTHLDVYKRQRDCDDDVNCASFHSDSFGRDR